MGYGKRALKLLRDYYAGKFTDLDENIDSNADTNGKNCRNYCFPIKYN